MSDSEPIICMRCQPCGPALMPVRYAAIPATVSPKLPAWAMPEQPFPQAEGYDYGLRAMRAGFLYVWYEELNLWEAWSITPDGGLWKQSDAPSARPKYTSACSRGIHRAASVEFIVLHHAALTSTAWVAFSPYKWNPALFDLYSQDADVRQKRMQPLESWQWSEPAQQAGITQATEGNLNTVLDYLPRGPAHPENKLPFAGTITRVTLVNHASPYYEFVRSSLRPRLTLYPWSPDRAGNTGRTMKMLNKRGVKEDGTAIKPLMMAVNDPIGIAHELTGWCDDMSLVHRTYRDELSLEFATYSNKMALEQMVRQGAGMKFDQSHTPAMKQRQIEMQVNTHFPDPIRDPQGKNRPSPEKISQHYDNVMAGYRKKEMAEAWDKYETQFDAARINDLLTTYKDFCNTLETRLNALIGYRLQWLTHALFIQCMDDFKSAATDDNLNYRELISYAIASINLAEVGVRKIEAWIAEYSVDNSKNLFWRAQIFNNPEHEADIRPVLDEMKKQAASKTPTVGDSALTLFASMMKYFGPIADSCDRALNALAADASSSRLSFSRRVFGAMDNILLSTTNLALNKTGMGGRIDSLNGMLFKQIFSLHAGVPQSKITAMLAAEVKMSGLFPTARGAEIQRAADKKMSAAEDRLSRLKDRMDEFIKTEEGVNKVKISRIKFLGVTFYSAQTMYLYHQSKGTFRDNIEWSAAAFFAASSLSGIVQFAYENGVKDSSLVSATKLAGATTGSIAAGLSVVVDFIDLIDVFNKDGLRLQTTGVKALRLLSDTAFAIQTTNEILVFFGEKTVEEILLTSLGRKAISSGVRIIGVMASWQVMVLITLLPWLIELCFNNDLQNWCEQSALGLEPNNGDTSLMNSEKLNELIDAQDIALSKAMHYTFGTELSDKAKQQEKAKQDEFDKKIGEMYMNSIMVLPL